MKPLPKKITMQGSGFAILVITLLVPNLFFSATVRAKTADEVCQKLHQKINAISLNLCKKIDFSTISITTKKHSLPIIYKKINTNKTIEKPKILVLGGIHSNELSSFELAIQWTKNLLKQKNALYDWLIAPAININALLKSHPTRQNVNNVDINRNFPLAQNSLNSPLALWERLGSKPRHYPGLKPFSEIETRTIDKLVKSFAPQLIITIHAPLNLIDYDGLSQNAPPKLGNLPLDLTESYPGSLASYYWNIKRIPVLTFELAHAKKLPPILQTSHIWYDLMLWLHKQYYPNLVPKDDVTLFNQAMEALTLNDLSQATFLFSKIKDTDLLLAAQNNLAYTLRLQNKREQAHKIWEGIIQKQSPTLRTIIKNYAINQKSQPTLSTIQLLSAPTNLLKKSDHLEEIRWRLNAWKDAQLNSEQSLYFSLYKPNHSPQKNLSYTQWKKHKEKTLSQKQLLSLRLENIQHQIITANKQAQSTFKQISLLNKKSTQSLHKKLIWEKHQDNWQISREITLKK